MNGLASGLLHSPHNGSASKLTLRLPGAKASSPDMGADLSPKWGRLGERPPNPPPLLEPYPLFEDLIQTVA